MKISQSSKVWRKFRNRKVNIRKAFTRVIPKLWRTRKDSKVFNSNGKENFIAQKVCLELEEKFWMWTLWRFNFYSRLHGNSINSSTYRLLRVIREKVYCPQKICGCGLYLRWFRIKTLECLIASVVVKIESTWVKRGMNGVLSSMRRNTTFEDSSTKNLNASVVRLRIDVTRISLLMGSANSLKALLYYSSQIHKSCRNIYRAMPPFWLLVIQYSFHFISRFRLPWGTWSGCGLCRTQSAAWSRTIRSICRWWITSHQTRISSYDSLVSWTLSNYESWQI